MAMFIKIATVVFVLVVVVAVVVPFALQITFTNKFNKLWSNASYAISVLIYLTCDDGERGDEKTDFCENSTLSYELLFM